MSLYAPVFGENTVLQVNDGASSAFADLDNYIALTPPSTSRAKVMRKVLRRSWEKNVVAPVVNFKDLQITYESSVDADQRYAGLEGVSKSWKVIYEDGLTLAFTGTLYDHTRGQIQDGNTIVTNSALIAVQSLITISAGTPPTWPA